MSSPPARSPGGARRAVSRLPIRVRLVAGFVVAVTVVLALAGTFVYWRVEYALDRRLDSDLQADASAIAPVLGAGGRLGTADTTRTPAARRYQVLDPTGRVVAYGADVGPAPLLTPARAARARRARVVANIGELLPVSRRPLRVLAEPLQGRPAGTVLVVADRRDQRDEALRELLAQLAAAGLAALVVTAVVGERLARAALAPVERYRTQAASIAAGATGVRLDVPAARDDEVTRLGHTLNDVLEALEQAVVRERRFTQDASHELRTPLSLLSGRIQLALRRSRDVAEHEEVLRELSVDVRDLTALAEGLLALTTSSSTLAGSPAGCDLAAVVRDVAASRPGEARLGAVPGSAVPVRMPEAAVRQVLTNLVDNAVLHGGGSRATLDVEVLAGGPAVLRVTDAGAGIDPGFLVNAADRFARSDTARALPGAGLGLSLVRALVDDAGGELRLCSNGVHHRYRHRYDVACSHPAEGTTATVLLPTATRADRPSSDLHV